MADYNSNYTGQEIDEAVEKTLSEVPEYWIPLESSGGVLSVPADKEAEVDYALINSHAYNILGCKFVGGAAIYGYRKTANEFGCPLTSTTASEFGIAGTANIVVKSSAGEGVSVELVPDIFIVTLTPTAQDYSGTMDKTPVEIDEAYRAGRRIRFRVMGMDAEVDATQYVDNTTEPEYYQAAANVIYNGMLVQIITSRLDQTYRTVIYPLTPMS